MAINMKERKCSILQRMLAVFLAAVLTAGMASNAVPAGVLAQEGSGAESVSGNDVELAEEETEPESAGGNDVELTEKETKPESVSGNDIKADDMAEMMYAARAGRDDSAISCSLDGGTTWTGCDAIENVLFHVSGYGSCENPIIRLNKDITLDGPGAVSLLTNNNNVLIDGQGHTIRRGTNTGYLFGNNDQAGTLTFRNVTIDGGAVWDNAENVKARTNSGFSAGGNAWLIYCTNNADAEVILDNGAILQNNHLNNSSFNGAAVMMESGSLTMKAGAVIRNNTAIGTSGNYGGGSGAVHVGSGASFTMEGGEIYGNYASLSGGAIVNQGSFTLAGGVIHSNVSGNNGGAISAQGQGTTVISGGEIKDNNAPAGGGIAVLSGTTKISGGAVHDNTATLGGGVYNAASTTKISGGAVYNNTAKLGGGVYNADNLSVSGTAKIQNNSNGNVYLPDSKIITIDASLSDGAAIGVKTQSAPTEGSPVSITGVNSADYSKYFTSDNKEYEIANGTDNVVQLTLHTHDHRDWRHDDAQHWKECTCGDVIYRATHDFGDWVTDKEATTTEAGAKHRECRACGYVQTETIPKTGGGNQSGGSSSGGNQGGGGNGGAGDSSGGSSNNAGNTVETGADTSKTPGAPGAEQPRLKQEKEGNIWKEVRVEGESTLDAVMETPISELSDMVLTEEEKQKAADGTDIRIVLDVKDASAVVTEADKALVEKMLDGAKAKDHTLGQYLDISLYKVIGNSRNFITETDRKVTVIIDVPDSLKNTDSTKTRTFAVIRVHEGKAELLADLDNNEDIITIATDRFSTYAVVYKDTAGGKDNEPKTGDNTPLELCATLAMIAGFAYLLLYFADKERGMTEETKNELVSGLAGWAKQGGRIRRYLALAAIFVLLVYYHSIGKKTCAEWKAIYGG